MEAENYNSRGNTRENKLGFEISQLRAIEMKGLENGFPFVGSIPMHAREREREVRFC